MSIGPRKNFIGSARYGVAINLKSPEFTEAMSGEIHFYDGKHVVDTKRFLTFDQLAKSIISYWESSLQTELNTRRFANWLSEYLEDLGVKNANFYKILEAITDIGRGFSLKSTGIPVKEVKVVPDEFAPVKEEKSKPKVSLKPVGTFKDHRQLEEPPLPKEEKEKTGKILEGKKVLPVPSRKIETPPEDELVKPSQLFGKKETVSPTVRVLPRVKKGEKKEEPPGETLLKPSEALKKRETIFETKKSQLGLKEEPYVLPAPEEKEEEKLLRPSEVLKQRDTLPTIRKEIEKPRKPIVTKVVSQPTKVRKLQPPEDRLVRPSELFRKSEEEKKKEKVEHLVRPSEILKKKPRKKVEVITVRKNDVERFQISTEPKKKEIPSVAPLPKRTELEREKSESSSAPSSTKQVSQQKVVLTKPKRKLKEEEIQAMPVPKKIETGVEKEKPTTELKKAEKMDIENIKGVGARTAKLLKEAGYTSVEKIANATADELAKIKGIGLSTAAKIINNAKQLL